MLYQTQSEVIGIEYKLIENQKKSQTKLHEIKLIP
jgi:hypothetical protein